MKITSELTLKKKSWLESLREELIHKYFSIEFEKKLQDRWSILDANKVLTLNGQKVRVVDYISALKNDLNNLESRIDLVDELLKEMK